MSEKEYLYHYWKYYLNLESKVINLNEYIAFTEENKECFSNEIMHLLVSICCEIDIMFKLILKISATDFGKIDNYRKKISSNNDYSKIIEETLDMIDYGSMEFSPFEEFKEKTPVWWKAYNGLKHNRMGNFNSGTLDNLLNALGALYILEIYYYKNNYFQINKVTNIPDKESKLFRAKFLKANFSSTMIVELDEVEEDLIDE